ncbi:MAG: ABC transporter ATP-binding protein [Pseudomonadota bacterium]
MTDFSVDKLTLEARGKPLVKAASFGLSRGELVAVIGPNGSGKTSLLRGSLGLSPMASGSAMLGGEDIRALDPMERARQIAYLPQTRPLAWPSRVRDVVALGRFSHGAAPGRLKGADAKAVDHALAACDLTGFADRATDTLSGGELARVHFARAFSAEARLLVADEPVAALDPRHQFRILDLVASFVQEGGGALVVLHDLNLAARYASRLIWMMDGEILSDGPPGETLTSQRVEAVFGLRAQITGDGVLLKP